MLTHSLWHTSQHHFWTLFECSNSNLWPAMVGLWPVWTANYGWWCQWSNRIWVLRDVVSVSISRWSRGVFSNVSVSSRSRRSNNLVSSRSRDSNVSVSSRSRLLTSRLHRTSKFKLRTIIIKILYSVQRYLGCLSISVENRHFCLFLIWAVEQYSN